MKIEVYKLKGCALDIAVAKCESVDVEYINDGITRYILRVSPFTGIYRPSVDWSLGGPLIERERIEVGPSFSNASWIAGYPNKLTSQQCWSNGSTPLIAAMRCFVASRLGNEVEVPEELS